MLLPSPVADNPTFRGPLKVLIDSSWILYSMRSMVIG